jgi:thioredoxin-related protein
MALRITVVSLLLALFIFHASAKSVKNAKHEKGMLGDKKSLSLLLYQTLCSFCRHYKDNAHEIEVSGVLTDITVTDLCNFKLRSTPKGYTTCKKAVVTACCPVDNLLI